MTDTIDKIRALISPADPKKASDKDIIGWLYGALSILDSKASGLLTANGLLIAALTIVLGLWGAKESPIKVPDFYGNIVFYDLFPLIISSFLCFLIVRVSWKFLEQARTSNAPGKYDFSEEIRKLAGVMDRRTRFYYGAWWITFITASLSIIIGFGHYLGWY